MDPELPRWWNDCEGEQMPGSLHPQPEEGVFVTLRAPMYHSSLLHAQAFLYRPDIGLYLPVVHIQAGCHPQALDLTQDMRNSVYLPLFEVWHPYLPLFEVSSRCSFALLSSHLSYQAAQGWLYSTGS